MLIVLHYLDMTRRLELFNDTNPFLGHEYHLKEAQIKWKENYKPVVSQDKRPTGQIAPLFK
jgi:hypothetical protein